MNAEDHITSRLNLYKGRYCIFGGAGVSVCAGVPLACTDLPSLPSIVTHVRRDYYTSLRKPPLTEAELMAWYTDQKLLQNADTLYSDALNLIGDTPRSRQLYLRRFFDGKKPGQAHCWISRLIREGFLDAVFTTNFDSFFEDSIREVTGLAAKVAAHSETVNDVLLTDPGPKVIKLHGDYLFSDIRNTEEETKSIAKNMSQKLRTFLGERGLIVVGYSGSDQSVMSLFEEMSYDGGFFPYGLYWTHLRTSRVNKRVESLIQQTSGRLLAIDGALEFFENVAQRCSGA